MDIFNDAGTDLYDPFKERNLRRIFSEELEGAVNQQINIAGAMDPNPNSFEDMFKTPGSIFSPIAY